MDDKRSEIMGDDRRLRGLPLQAAPVHRSPAGAARNTGAGVEPSWGWGDVWDVVKNVGGVISKL